MNFAVNNPVHKVVLDTNVFISAFYLPGSIPAEVLLLAMIVEAKKEIRSAPCLENRPPFPIPQRPHQHS
jgi:hypothetical protein